MSDKAKYAGKGFGYYMYNGGIWLLSPIILTILGLRLTSSGKSRVGLSERFGKLPESATKLKDSGDPVIWMHAVSVGEVAAAEAILAEIKALAPLARVV
ncbi:MAG TPA: glycosyltransferase N-terminal domain-containing protein, partial [Armatimonadota bacterium]|nr:glycosyltransferase N-terminal domain-containing protein [Armatimonadota bacterium]